MQREKKQDGGWMAKKMTLEFWRARDERLGRVDYASRSPPAPASGRGWQWTQVAKMAG
jgi:hypothetical protein